MSWPLSFSLTFYIMSVLSDYLINSISINKVLGILQHYLKEVSKCQYASEVFTNNIFIRRPNSLSILNPKLYSLFYKLSCSYLSLENTARSVNSLSLHCHILHLYIAFSNDLQNPCNYLLLISSTPCFSR